MSPVTAQGVAAQNALDSSIESAAVEVVQEMGQAEVSINDLLSRMPETPPEIVREAVWQLLDDDIILLTEHRLLRRSSED